MDKVSLNVSELIATVKQHALQDTHEKLDDLLARYCAQQLTKGALQVQVRDIAGRDALREALKSMVPNIEHRAKVREVLVALFRAVASDDADILQPEIESAASSQLVDEATMLRARQRLAQLVHMRADKETRRKEMGISTIPYPQDLCCPISLHKMIDPVVASDGHTYERKSIETLLGSEGSRRSPMTRELLETTLIPNRTLLKRIMAYDDEMLNCAALAAKAALVSSVTALSPAFAGTPQRGHVTSADETPAADATPRVGVTTVIPNVVPSQETIHPVTPLSAANQKRPQSEERPLSPKIKLQRRVRAHDAIWPQLA